MGIVPLNNQLRLVAALWMLIGVLFLIPYLFTDFMHPALGGLALAIGLVLGLGFGYAYEKRELRIIDAKGQNSLTRARSSASLALTIGIAIAILVLLALFVPSSFWWDYNAWKLIGAVGFTIYAPIVPLMFITRIRMIKRWQNKNNNELLIEQKRLSWTIFKKA